MWHFLGEAAEDPESIEEALQSQLSKQWQEAADAEFQSLIDTGTWELVKLPKISTVATPQPVMCLLCLVQQSAG